MNRIRSCLLLALCLPAIVLGAADNPLANANNAFALDLYGQLRAQEGNLFFSPYSISVTLAMAYAGARGETAAQMAKALHFDLPQDELHTAFAALAADLQKKGKGKHGFHLHSGGKLVYVGQQGEIRLFVANSLWPRKKYSLLPDYLNLCRKNYDPIRRDSSRVNVLQLVYSRHDETNFSTDWASPVR